MDKYLATQIVHCPSGPTYACDEHAHGIRSLMAFMGAHTVAEHYEGEAECDNCVNENKSHDVHQAQVKETE